MYVPLYPAGLLYHPVATMRGYAKARLGPWTWVSTVYHPTPASCSCCSKKLQWIRERTGCKGLGCIPQSKTNARAHTLLTQLQTDMTGVDVSINPGALQYNVSTTTVDGKQTETMQYSLWTSKPDGGTLGKVYTSTSPTGPFVEVPNSNSASFNPGSTALRVLLLVFYFGCWLCAAFLYCC